MSMRPPPMPLEIKVPRHASEIPVACAAIGVWNDLVGAMSGAAKELMQLGEYRQSEALYKDAASMKLRGDRHVAALTREHLHRPVLSEADQTRPRRSSLSSLPPPPGAMP